MVALIEPTGKAKIPAWAYLVMTAVLAAAMALRLSDAFVGGANAALEAVIAALGVMLGVGGASAALAKFPALTAKKDGKK